MTDYFDFIKSLMEGEKREEALKGLKVVEITHFIFGPNIGRVLAQYGAEVVKIETPGEGDRYRIAAIFGRFYKRANLLYAILNANKYIIAADARNEKARKIIFELIKKADVFVENLSAGLVDAMGIGYEAIRKVNPRIIYVSCSGYGQYGPLSRLPSFDVAAQGVAGVAMKTGWEDLDEFYKLPDYFGDYLPSMYAVFAVLSALYFRENTGKGQYIDISQCESLMRFMYDFTYFSLTGEEIGKTGNLDPASVPSGIFRTKDGKFVAISILTSSQFEALKSLIPQLENGNRFEKSRARDLNKIVAKWVEERNLEEILELAKKHRFPASPVLDDKEIAFDPWRWERGSILKVKDRLLGELPVPGPIIAMSATPGKIKWLGRPVGYHNRLILKKWLGLSDREIDELEKEGVIGYWDEMPGLAPPATWDAEKDEVFRGEKDEEG
ncbi:MAG: CoA transferase [Archaeoglobus sp.]|jgi:crotonobetainyl-CoA:carnitine CoA-transferase CaiB-like acyl-CoA transferase|nr:CoA transferase [Archaeoglobus sp.]